MKFLLNRPWILNIISKKHERFRDTLFDCARAFCQQVVVPTNMNSNVLALLSDDCPRCVDLACESLKNGGLIAVPTDTVYGIACLAQNQNAVERIYALKGRNSNKPIAISVGDVADIYRWAKVTIPRPLLKKLLPGPVTVVFERTAALNSSLNPGTRLVGVRVPDSGFVREISRGCQSPIALTSANISSHESTLSVQEFEVLWSSLDFVFDKGTLGSSPINKQGSTVVDLSKRGQYTIIREGCAFDSTVSILRAHGLREGPKV